MLKSFFLYGPPPSTIETGYYQLPLVLLSYVVASFASYTALVLTQQLVSTRSLQEKRWLHIGGAFAMGAGIWSMHFIGMLSYKMRMVVEYDPGLTFLSMLIAIAVAYGVFSIVARKQLTTWPVLMGGTLLGLGICGMHYTGMAAMKMDATLYYFPGIFLLSVVIAIFASVAALWMAFTLARHDSPYRTLFQVGAALIMGAAICGMHYTGMWASVMVPFAQCRYDPNQNFDMLAWAIAGITALILATALAVGIYRKTQIELQLRNNEIKLRAMIDNALDGFIAMDQHGEITEWNKQAEVIFGWPYEKAIGQQLAELIIPPASREAHYHGMKRFLEQGVGNILGRRIEVMALHRSGALFPIELTVTAQKLYGSPHFTAFVRDISARKQSEEKMGLLASIVASSDDAILSRTLDGMITSWNASAEQLLGYTTKEAIGQDIHLIIPPECLQEEQHIMEQLREGRPVDHLETVRRTKGGKYIEVSLTISPICNAAGEVIGASKIIRDITARKQAEREIKESQERYRALVESSEQVVWTWKHGVIDPASPFSKWWEITTGQSAGDIGTFGWLNVVHPEDRAHVQKIWGNAISNGENFEVEYRLRTRAGNYLHVAVRGVALFTEEQSVREFIGTLNDITVRKEAEAHRKRYMQELERSNQELDEFAYIASHDLKEPLRGLFNHALFLIEDYEDKLGEDGVKRLKRLGQLAQRMENLVNDLLYFSRLGRADLAIQETDLNEVIKDIEQMLETFLKERNAHIIVPKPLPRIVCDKPRVTEVFQNLIINAVKYNDKPERRIEIGFLEQVETPKGIEKQVFYVKDNGVGIAPEFYQEVFRIFKRLQRRTEEKESGTGAGLTFVKKIVERHDGRIWLESELNKGTTFYFTLPRRKS